MPRELGKLTPSLDLLSTKVCLPPAPGWTRGAFQSIWRPHSTFWTKHLQEDRLWAKGLSEWLHNLTKNGMAWVSLARPRFLYQSKPFKMKLQLRFSQRGFPQKKLVFTGFNPLVEVLLLQLVTAANSPVSNPPLSDWHSHTTTQPSRDSVFQRRWREAGAGTLLTCFPLPGGSQFFFPLPTAFCVQVERGKRGL